MNQALVRLTPAEERRNTGGPQPPVVLACSALKQSYRDRLSRGLRDVRFVFLKAPREAIRERLAARPGHFMPASLLDSQLATLEEPTPGSALHIDSRAPIAEIVDRVESELKCETWES